MTPAAAFYILVWVYAVQHPGGGISERQDTFLPTIATQEECMAKASLAASGIPLENLTTDGGDAIYSRFICVPSPGA